MRCTALAGVIILMQCGGAALRAEASGAPPAQHPDLWRAESAFKRDPAGEVFIERLLRQMSLEEKIGQMIQADIASITPADLSTYKLGSILAGGNAAPAGNIRAPAQAWLDMVDEFYRASLQTQGVHIPLLFGIDAVHGNAKVPGATIFPHNVGLGAAHDPALMRLIGQATAEEVAAVGIDWTFAPTVAVARDVRWGRSYESYSESPQLVAEYAAAMVTGLQGQRGTSQFMAPGRTLSSVKHFIGDGATAAGRDQGESNISEDELRTVHAAGYPAAIAAGAMIVMASYNSWNGTKVHADHYLLTDILKGRLGFDGFVVGDWNAHEQIPGCSKYDCAPAILAGVDMLMAPDSWQKLFENTVREVRSGAIPQARIEDAVRRILRVKFTAGLFDRAAPKQRPGAGNFTTLGSAEHRTLARAAVRESLVLLKNDHATLPLSHGAKILVAGNAADSVPDQSGGWTIDWQGDHNRNADFPGATSIYAGISAALAAGGGSARYSPEGLFTEKPDAAIVVFGEKPYAEFEGDREILEFSPDDKSALILLRRLRTAGIPTISVFLSGRPLWVNPELNASDAFIAAWLPGSEGEGVADLLFGGAGAIHYDFRGRLAFSWPSTAMPVISDATEHVHGALYPRGWGLDYQHSSQSAPLPQDPAIPAHWQASAGSLFHAGHVTAPWSIFVADDSGEVHLTTMRQASPQAAVRAVLVADGDGIVTAQWSGPRAGIFRISGRAMDLNQKASLGSVLQMRYRVDQPPRAIVSVGMQCNDPLCSVTAGAMLDLTTRFRAARPGEWHTLSIPLTCLRDTGADLAEVTAPFVIATAGQFGLSISEIRLSDGRGQHKVSDSTARAANAPCVSDVNR